MDGPHHRAPIRTPASPLKRAIIAGVAISLILSTVAVAVTATLSIDGVGGQTIRKGKVQGPVSGAVQVNGTASLNDAQAPAPETTALVADAGDSPLVEAGQPATLRSGLSLF